MSRLAKARRFVFFGVAGVLAAATSRGTTSGFSWPPGRALVAGSSVSLAWSLPAGHDDGFGEMELVLSFDEGRTFPIRVTRDLDPATRALTWRVPALPWPRARLALRVGDSGEPADEEILIVSEEFSIEAGAVSRPEQAAFVGGEWRTLETLENGQSAPRPDLGFLEETAPALSPAGRAATAAARRPRAVAAEKFTLLTAAFEAFAPSEQPIHHICLPRIPADLPRRE